jgi:hypothetical protein
LYLNNSRTVAPPFPDACVHPISIPPKYLLKSSLKSVNRIYLKLSKTAPFNAPGIPRITISRALVSPLVVSQYVFKSLSGHIGLAKMLAPI